MIYSKSLKRGYPDGKNRDKLLDSQKGKKVMTYEKNLKFVNGTTLVHKVPSWGSNSFRV